MPLAAPLGRVACLVLLPDWMPTMDLRTVEDSEEWDRALLALPRPHVLQSSAWGRVKAVSGWSPRRLLLEERGVPRAAALVLRRRVPLLGAPVLYVPQGPLLGSQDALLRAAVLEALEREAREERAILVKIDPDVAAEDGGFVDLLARRGWRRGEDVQFRNTVLVDLGVEEGTLLARMKPKTRYNIRLAERRGVQVRAGTDADLVAFYELYRATGRRDGFLTRPLAYYRTVWRTFLEADLGRLWLAEHQGELLAGLFLVRFGPTAWYLYGASADRKRELMPNYLLQWQAMRWAREAGCTTYDLWGAPERLEEGDPLWGVYRFKEGFGGRFVARVGAYDFAARPALYLLFTWAVPRLLALWRRLRGEPTLRQAGP